MIRAAVVLWILSAVVCVGRGAHDPCHVQDTTVDRFNDGSAMVILANKEFAFHLYRKLSGLSDSQGKNIFFSPVSVSVALAALSVGARGETHQQIFNGLGFNISQLSQSDVDQAFCSLLANTRSHEDISAGTAVFVDNLFKPQPEFLDALKQSYLSEGFSVDFTKATDTAKTINKYVSDKTSGKIDKLVDSLDPSTVMYLLSYIYYKGTWSAPLDPTMTKPDEFSAYMNKVSVQMMKIKKHFYTYEEAIDTGVLHLLLNNSFSMLLMLPGNMTTLENGISSAHVTKWLKGTESSEFDIYVPKFSIKASYTLNDVLKEMGMTDMFDANLSGISKDQNLTVSEVVHQAALDVDEVGAAAAAATGSASTVYLGSPEPDLKFDRPFMLIIIDRYTENIFFMGKIVNPNL
ncbi:alpha-1-antitrypsin-like protein CM55-SI [Nematolebias whitei]|uniref:alpha-1-antitrypsin-like protein CM55-SI n=1 Tax=Nematolebias whitei TaxID=451745 RepID=UPI0018994FC3|nr:alpha-1-antitrypsin-like protein CM55-SI [Nematolebias whitei]